MSIIVDGLLKKFGNATVIDGISFTVEKGEFVSLLGPSGCGKTTTLRAIAGLEEINGGTLSIAGNVVSAPERGIMTPPHLRQIGMVFQSYAIWPHMTVAENVSFPLRVRGVAAPEIEPEVAKALAIVGLEGLRHRRPSELSGGQQQRVALARAIVGSPDILLFDEPLSNLDAKLRESTRGEIRRLQKRLGIAALYVTHDQEEALSMSDRVVVMDGGRIVQEAPPKELYRNPANRFAASFVGKASFIAIRGNGESWHCADGTEIAALRGRKFASQQGEIMVRPEWVSIEPLTRGAEAGDESRIQLVGEVVDRQFLGGFAEYMVSTAGTTVRAHSEVDWEVGSQVQLSFSKENLRLITG